MTTKFRRHFEPKPGLTSVRHSVRSIMSRVIAVYFKAIQRRYDLFYVLRPDKGCTQTGGREMWANGRTTNEARYLRQDEKAQALRTFLEGTNKYKTRFLCSMRTTRMNFLCSA